MCERIVRALAPKPRTSEDLARELHGKPGSLGALVSNLRRARVVQPSGFHGLTRYGKRAVRWEVREGPYAPEVPAGLLAVLREVLGPELTRPPSAPQFAASQ